MWLAITITVLLTITLRLNGLLIIDKPWTKGGEEHKLRARVKRKPKKAKARQEKIAWWAY